MTLEADDLISGNVIFQRRSSQQKKVWGSGTELRHTRNFFFKDSGVFVQVTKAHWNNYFDCFMNFR